MGGVGGEKGLRFTAISSRRDASPARSGGPVEQCRQDWRRNSWHVARDNYIPVRRRDFKSGVDSAQRPAAWQLVAHYRISQKAVSLRVPNQNHAARSLLDRSRHVRDQRSALKLQQSFVPAHPGTPATRQHKSGAQHERIIALPTGSTISFTGADVPAAILRNEPGGLAEWRNPGIIG